MAEFTKKLIEAVPGGVLENEPMSARTSFRIGGPCDYFVTPSSRAELCAVLRLCLEYGVKAEVIGAGTNILVRDQGVRGVVVSTQKMDSISVCGETELYADAGARLSSVAALAEKEALSGLEFAAGIPGSFGGAVFMNAGAYGGEISGVLTSADILRDGEIRTLAASELDLGYRRSAIRGMPGAVILGGKIKLSPGSAEEIHAKTTEFNRLRREKQPLDKPSAGSAFKRPPGNFAGKLIMDAGLSGFSIGGAAVSEKHCGFIVNNGSATEGDVMRVVEHVKSEVFRQFGVELEMEIVVI